MRNTARILTIAYITVLAALLAAAVAIWNLHCEGFGCMGVGVAWFAWAIAFFIVMALGLLARSKARAANELGGVATIACWLQVLIGCAAIAAWLLKR